MIAIEITMTYSKSVRERIVFLLKEGRSSRSVASKVGVSHTLVQQLRRKYVRSAPPKAGRKRLISDSDADYIVHLVKVKKYQTAVDVQQRLKHTSNFTGCVETVRRALKRVGFRARVKRRKPYLSPNHRRRRMRFARKYQHWDLDDWRKVIFSDETKICMYGSDGRQYCLRQRGQALHEANLQPTVKHGGGSLMLWSCICAQGIGYMCRIDTILDSELYCRILDDELMKTLKLYKLKASDIIFQQDGDPKHNARIAQEWLVDNNIKTFTWPPQSPDLNVIEHMWWRLKERLNSYPTKPSNKGELWQRIEEQWEMFTADDCRSLIDTMPQRIRDVIKAKGGPTRW